MKYLTNILIKTLLIISFVITNSFVWYTIYHLGLRPFINECGITSPNISYIYFVLLNISYNMISFTNKRYNEIRDIGNKKNIVRLLEILFIKWISISILFVINYIFI